MKSFKINGHRPAVAVTYFAGPLTIARNHAGLNPHHNSAPMLPQKKSKVSQENGGIGLARAALYVSSSLCEQLSMYRDQAASF
ncbi:hypothetical protein [Mesorhizobium sp.]|uniref:hypothetical protein n=1 Tax=Mesorhizobium sp. TaxID=1871066 RepID=UPI00120A736D|nr:hypothetical protein [Mesorhizobium sp.]TIN74617.1 MAG: hypothetical protein E5Y09_31900 [Mesorhizobium sp.]TIO65584.1 MAG: hypothetical protein E5X85_28045 [Mesorhizobium sp.]TJV85500.1 MAG: hypothetical protein E5X84_32190 [Mesorhizobium sp.]